MGDVVVLLLIGAVAAAVGVWLGIVLIAPRVSRALDRAEKRDEEPGDRPA